MKVLLTRFHLNGRTIGIHPHYQKLEAPKMCLFITDSGSEGVKIAGSSIGIRVGGKILGVGGE